ncbi:MAG: ABC transporter permease [Rikenellaceae bacterium]
MFKAIEEIGKYTILMGRVFRRPQKMSIFRARTVNEMNTIGLQTIGIVILLSFFMGAAIVMQTTNNLENPLLPRYLIGYAGRESIVLEFSSTVLSLILAGKIGSNIASEVGTMRITEQIDGLEIMGINSANYLILPKIVAAVFFFPLLTSVSILCGLVGGYLMVAATDMFPLYDYVYGLQFDFEPFYLVYALIKSFCFGFIVTSVSGYFGYYAKGTSLEVGRSSTRAFVVSCIGILVVNIVLTQLMLTK